MTWSPFEVGGILFYVEDSPSIELLIRLSRLVYAGQLNAFN
jgi:hypothetical protein